MCVLCILHVFCEYCVLCPCCMWTLCVVWVLCVFFDVGARWMCSVHVGYIHDVAVVCVLCCEGCILYVVFRMMCLVYVVRGVCLCCTRERV